MKRIFVLLFVIFFLITEANAVGYKLNVPVEGKSIAGNSLQFEIMQKLYKKLGKEFSTCYDYSIYNTQVVHYPYDVKKKNDKYISGYWKEIWTVDCCNIKRQVPITFYITKKKTIYIFENLN